MTTTNGEKQVIPATSCPECAFFIFRRVAMTRRQQATERSARRVIMAMLAIALLTPGCRKFGERGKVEPEPLANGETEQESLGAASLGAAKRPTKAELEHQTKKVEERETRDGRQAIATIEGVHGSFEIDEQRPGKPVVRVDLSFTQISDAGLIPLEALKQLQELYLIKTKVTDTGLAALKSCSHLKTLDIAGTQVTDAGLAYLSGLLELKTLGLSDTKITDAGIRHLRALLRLRLLDLSGTKVTSAEVQELQKALPQVKILR